MTDRRQFLTATGIGLAALFAGCSGRRGTGAAPDESETATDTPTATATDTQTETESNDGYGDSYGSGGDDATTGSETVQVVADNVRASAWEFVGDSGIADDGENPTLAFETGTRYVVENRAWSAHPFAFLAADGSSLLTQEDGGTFADDSAVNWRDDGKEFAFTFTPDLADAVSRYVCTVHARMQGDVETA